MKKKAIVCIGVLTAAFMLAGCGKNGESSSTMASSQSGEASNSSVSSEQKEPSTGELTLEDVLAAPETDPSEFNWSSEEGGLCLRSCLSKDDIIVVPEEVDGEPVVRIDTNGLNFLECRALVLPDSVEDLEQGSLGVMDNLEILVYGAGMKEDLFMTAANLPNLKILFVREGAKNVPQCMVLNATDLQKVYFPASLTEETLQQDDILLNCGDPTFIVEPGSAAEQYAIDNGYKYENP